MKKKKFLLIIVPILFLAQCVWILMRNERSENIYRLLDSLKITKLNFFYPTTNVEEFVACKLPELNPWDPLILSNIVHPKDLYCKKEQPFFTYIDSRGYLRINQTEANLFRALNKTFSCFYWTFDRSLDDVDNIIAYDGRIELTEPVQLKKDHVKVKCYFVSKDKNDYDEFYFNLHAHPSKQRMDEFNYTQPTDDQLSVLMYVIDSVSYSVLQRNLPLTFNYTSNVMGFKYFKAFNKVGDNSFPNWMAMLMGKRIIDEQSDMLREMTGDYSKIQYDSWPLIWKRYAAKRYLTVFNEDNPQVGLFHFESRGFQQKPVDYYYHIFWYAVQAESNHDYICFRNEPKARMIMDLTKRHVMATHDKLQFMITATTELSHDSDNQVELIDDDLVALWKTLYEGDYLNKTVVIFASDHGLRMGMIRSTLIGLLEERLPFFGIWFPAWFYDRYPHIKRNLENNVNILSSHFDVYETLTDILNANYVGSQRNPNQRGQSQLYPLPKNRTCNGAGIPDHYCACSTETVLELNDTLVKEGAVNLVYHLNRLLSNVSDICHRIQLTKILFAKLVDVNGKVKQGVHNMEEVRQYEKGEVVNPEKVATKDIRIGIETQPKGAMFDALLRKTIIGRSKPWRVVGMVSRSNKYRGYSDCVDDTYLKKICTCKNV